MSSKSKAKQPSQKQPEKKAPSSAPSVSAEEAIQHVEKTAKEAGASSAPRLWKAWTVEVRLSFKMPNLICFLYAGFLSFLYALAAVSVVSLLGQEC